MNEDEHRKVCMTLRELGRAFALPADWPVIIRKPEGDITIAASELVRRIEKRYIPEPSALDGSSLSS